MFLRPRLVWTHVIPSSATQVSYPYTTQPMCSEHKHRIHCQTVGNGHTLPAHSQARRGRRQKHTAHLQLFVELTSVRRRHAFLVPRHIKWWHGGEILCTSHSLSITPPKVIFHTTQPSACFKMCRRNMGQQPKNYSETSGHPLTIAWNRLIFPISYSNYNSFPHCHLQCSLQLEDCSAKARPSSSLPKSFVMEMSFGI